MRNWGKTALVESLLQSHLHEFFVMWLFQGTKTLIMLGLPMYRISRIKSLFLDINTFAHSKSIGQYVLTGPFVAVHFIACGERRAKLACTARRYKQVYCYRRVAKNILLYSLYWAFAPLHCVCGEIPSKFRRDQNLAFHSLAGLNWAVIIELRLIWAALNLDYHNIALA
jgi:hypothetical protein